VLGERPVPSARLELRGFPLHRYTKAAALKNAPRLMIVYTITVGAAVHRRRTVCFEVDRSSVRSVDLASIEFSPLAVYHGARMLAKPKNRRGMLDAVGCQLWKQLLGKQ
jgi:hypothetical protein